MPTANLFMSKLSGLGLDAGSLEIIRGQFAERWIEEAEALNHYKAATKASPQGVGAWGALVGFHMRHGRFAQASRGCRRRTPCLA